METVWFFLLAAMLGFYTVLDGWDLGVGIIYHSVSRTEKQREYCMAALSPLWSGNEVWLIASGTSLFLAFPRVFAVSFSGFYLGLMPVLWLLIARGVSIEFRNQVKDSLWRTLWDSTFFGASVLLSLLLGVTLGNIIRGLPLDAKGEFQGSYTMLLNPFSLLVGATSLALLALHGANYLCMKISGPLYDRTRALTNKLGPVVFVLFVATTISGHFVRANLADNYFRHPLTLVFPVMALAALIGAIHFARRSSDLLAYAATSLLIFSLLFSAAVSVYPYLLYSINSSGASIDIYHAGSSQAGLVSGFWALVPILALVLIYQAAAYRMFSGRLHKEDLEDEY